MTINDTYMFQRNREVSYEEAVDTLLNVSSYNGELEYLSDQVDVLMRAMRVLLVKADLSVDELNDISGTKRFEQGVKRDG